ncbi:hypothetical protein ACM7I5_10815 [Pseudomonas aeruginosa]
MSSTQLIEQCTTRLRGIVEALDNIHDTSPHRWSTDLDDVHSSAESLLAMIEGQAPALDAQGLAGTALTQPSPTLPPFAEKVLAKLRRFYDCAGDFESGGVDIGRHWLDLLTQLGLLNRVQRSPALWEISQQGDDLLEGQAAQAGQMPQAWLDVQAERKRQVEVEGWTPEHDDAHSHGQMARAPARALAEVLHRPACQACCCGGLPQPQAGPPALRPEATQAGAPGPAPPELQHQAELQRLRTLHHRASALRRLPQLRGKECTMTRSNAPLVQSEAEKNPPRWRVFI